MGGFGRLDAMGRGPGLRRDEGGRLRAKRTSPPAPLPRGEGRWWFWVAWVGKGCVLARTLPVAIKRCVQTHTL